MRTSRESVPFARAVTQSPPATPGTRSALSTGPSIRPFTAVATTRVPLGPFAMTCAGTLTVSTQRVPRKRHGSESRGIAGRYIGEHDAMHIGVTSMLTDRTMTPAQFAVAVEERGFESLWLPEHSHIPTSRESPWPG